MTEWIVTSCVLILIVTGLRSVLKGRIGLRLQYSLWLLVLLRLLIPFSVPSPLSIMNMIPEPQSLQPTQGIETAAAEIPEAAVLPQLQQQTEDIQMQQTPIQPKASVSTGAILMAVWITGMGVTALVLLGSNLHFALRLKRSRIPVRISGCPLPVYRTNIVATPCLCGIIRPKIYLTQEVTEEQSLNHILTHELSHFKHLDPIWSFLRCICLVLHWYNPLVWMAAVLSKQDGELACDEATIQHLGQSQRQAYGRTLIRMTQESQNRNTFFLTATSMTGGKSALKERIFMIAKHPKTTLFTMILVCIAAVVTAGCTFTGPQEEIPVTNTPVTKAALSYIPTAEPYYMDDGLQACFVNVDGTVYVWDCSPNSGITQDQLGEQLTYVGTVMHNEILSMPSQHLSACRLDVGTKLYIGQDVYSSMTSDVLYCTPCPGSSDKASYGRLIPESRIRGDDRWWETKTSSAAIAMTMDDLKTLIAEKGNLLYSSDFEDYIQTRFGSITDYRILPLEDGYRLFLMFHPNPEVELIHAKLYHIDSPEKYIDPLTESIHDFLNAQ